MKWLLVLTIPVEHRIQHGLSALVICLLSRSYFLVLIAVVVGQCQDHEMHFHFLYQTGSHVNTLNTSKRKTKIVKYDSCRIALHYLAFYSWKVVFTNIHTHRNICVCMCVRFCVRARITAVMTIKI